MANETPIQCVSEVINKANHEASLLGCSVGICWNADKSRWETYSLLEGTDHEPEFICYGTGKIPIPLTDDAASAFDSLVRSRLQAQTVI